MRTVCEKQIEFYEKLSRMRLVGDDDSVHSAPAAAAAPAPAPAASVEPEPAPAKEAEVEETVRSIETSAVNAALDEPEQTLTVDTDIPAEEEEPTRRFGDDAGARKKRSFDDFRFDDSIG